MSMQKQESISILQASMLIITAVGILDHVLIIPVLFQHARRDAWFSIALAGIPLLIWTLLLYFIMKRSGQQHLFTWLKSYLGGWGARFVLLFILIQLFFMSAISLRDTAYWANTTYLPKTPNLVLASIFMGIALLAASLGIRTIAITNGILLPFVVILGFFVMISNSPFKDYALLFPLFEHGFEPVVQGVFYALSGFSEFIYLLFIQHRLQTKTKFLPLLITAFILVDLMLSPTTGALAIFGPDEAARMRYPAFEQWRMVSFGHFLEHVDFFSIYQWLVGGFIRLSLGLFMVKDLTNLPRGKWQIVYLVIISLLMVAASQTPVSDKLFLQWLSAIYLPASLSFHALLFLVFGGLALIRLKKKVAA